jgi:hypothetical protein
MAKVALREAPTLNAISRLRRKYPYAAALLTYVLVERLLWTVGLSTLFIHSLVKGDFGYCTGWICCMPHDARNPLGRRQIARRN